jgi:hypothetical protein
VEGAGAARAGDRYRLDVAVQPEAGETLLEGGSIVLVDDIPEQ